MAGWAGRMSCAVVLAVCGRAVAADLTELQRLRAEQCAGAPGAERIFAAAVEVLRGMPARDAREAVRNVLLLMRHELVGGAEIPRGPHEWDARTALACRSVNGCVEAAKVFFSLFRTAYPDFPALYLDSFNASCPGAGHAVVEVDSGAGPSFIVDAAAFERLEDRLQGGARVDFAALTEGQLAQPVDFRPAYQGRVVQLPEDADLFATKAGGRYWVIRYPYGKVFDGETLEERPFDSLDGLNAFLSEAVRGRNSRAEVSFEDLRAKGLILGFADPGKTSFMYADACGPGQAKHVVYGCVGELPEKDLAEEREPALRAQYEKTGRAGGCVRGGP